MNQKVQSLGWKISRLQVVNSTVPGAGAYRYSYRADLPDGRTFNSFGYLLDAGAVFLIGGYDDPANETQRFLTFVRSFRLLDPALH
jgi:hypothetical protein